MGVFKIQTKAIIALPRITTHRNMLQTLGPLYADADTDLLAEIRRLVKSLSIHRPLLRSCATCELFLRLSQIQFNCDNNKIYLQQFVSSLARRVFCNLVTARQRIIIMCLAGWQAACAKSKLYNPIDHC